MGTGAGVRGRASELPAGVEFRNTFNKTKVSILQQGEIVTHIVIRGLAILTLINEILSCHLYR